MGPEGFDELLVEVELPVLLLGEIGPDGIECLLQDESVDGPLDVVEHDETVAETVQDLGTVELHREEVAYREHHLPHNLLVLVPPFEVGDNLSILVFLERPEIAGEDDERLTEVRGIALPVGEPAVI